MSSKRDIAIKRGQIWCCNLNGIGSEQKGRRPVIIIQNDIGNRHSPTTIVVPITTKRMTKKLPTHLPILNLEYGSVALCEQITTIDKSRLIEFINYLEPYELCCLEDKLKISINI